MYKRTVSKLNFSWLHWLRIGALVLGINSGCGGSSPRVEEHHPSFAFEDRFACRDYEAILRSSFDGHVLGDILDPEAQRRKGLEAHWNKIRGNAELPPSVLAANLEGCEAEDVLYQELGRPQKEFWEFLQMLLSTQLHILDGTSDFVPREFSLDVKLEYSFGFLIQYSPKLFYRESVTCIPIAGYDENYDEVRLRPLEYGDCVTSIDQHSIRSYPGGISAAIKLLEQPTEYTRIKVGVRSKGSTIRTETVEARVWFRRTEDHRPPGHLVAHKLSSNLGYIQIRRFEIEEGATDAAFTKAIVRLDPEVSAWVVDLRYSIGGSVSAAEKIALHFTGEVPLLYLGRVINERGENRLKLEPRKTFERKKKPPVPAILKPVVVLVNEQTASAAELLARFIQLSGRGVIVGTKTYGKATLVNQAETSELLDRPTMTLVPGTVHLLSGLLYFRDGTTHHGRGLTSDFPVRDLEAERLQQSYHERFPDQVLAERERPYGIDFEALIKDVIRNEGTPFLPPASPTPELQRILSALRSKGDTLTIPAYEALDPILDHVVSTVSPVIQNHVE